jgi:hypothetical protein
MERARIEFRDLVGQATPADLRRRSNGTRWTNRQLSAEEVDRWLGTKAKSLSTDTLHRLLSICEGDG